MSPIWWGDARREEAQRREARRSEALHLLRLAYVGLDDSPDGVRAKFVLARAIMQLGARVPVNLEDLEVTHDPRRI